MSSSSRWRRVVALAYLLALVGTVAVVLLCARPRNRVGLAMVSFALGVLVLDCAGTWRLLAQMPDTRRAGLVATGLTLPVLLVWAVLGVVPPARLPVYFGLLAAHSVLQAVRDVVVLDVSPLELFDRGYPNLVAVFLVLGAAAETVDRFRLGLVLLGALVYAVRASFRWTGAVRG